MKSISHNLDSLAELPPVLPGIMAPGHDGSHDPSLLGGYCPDCGQQFFPRPRYCPLCLGPAEPAALSTRGAIYSYTVVRIKAPWGLPQPYPVGYVDLDESGLRVFSLLDHEAIDQLKVGLLVRLAVARLGHDINQEPCLRPYFSPIQAEGE